MAHGRRTGWTGRPRPRSRVRSPQGFAPVFQPGARLTGGSDFGSLPTIPASSWRHILQRFSRGIFGISNRFWAKNRTYRKQTIKPLLTGSRFAYKPFEIRQVFTQDLAPEDLRKTPGFSDFSAFLPGSAKNSRMRRNLLKTNDRAISTRGHNHTFPLSRATQKPPLESYFSLAKNAPNCAH